MFKHLLPRIHLIRRLLYGCKEWRIYVSHWIIVTIIKNISQ